MISYSELYNLFHMIIKLLIQQQLLSKPNMYTLKIDHTCQGPHSLPFICITLTPLLKKVIKLRKLHFSTYPGGTLA